MHAFLYFFFLSCIQISEGAIKNGQFRDTGNIGSKTQDNDKQNNKTQHMTTQKPKILINIDNHQRKKKKKGVKTQKLVKDKQLLPPIRHPPCYAYSLDVLDTTI